MKIKHSLLFLIYTVTLTCFAQNPVLVADIAPFPYASSPGPFCNFNGKLFFAANRYNGFSSNRELFVTDGTTVGTQLFKELVPGNTGSSPENFIVLNGKMYFTIYNQFPNTAFEIPYVSDGTPEGTFPLSTDNDVAVIGGANKAARFIFVALGNYVYFQSYEPNFPYNRVLYRTDGTQSGTQIVVAMPNNSNAPTLMQGPMKLGTKLIFASQINGFGSNLYSYDPVDSSIVLIRANTNFYSQYGWTEYNNKLYFTGNNLFDVENAAEPWVTDGTSAGTYEIENLNTLSGIDSAPGSYEVMNNKLFFIARATEGTNTVTLFSIDAAGLPIAIADIGGPTITYSDTYLYQFANKFYFKGENATNGSEPWLSDGTTSGTGMIKDIWSGSSGTAPNKFIAYCNYIYFTAVNPASGSAQTLYKTDGTSEGTVLIPGLSGNESVYGSGVTQKAVFDNKLFFAAQYDANQQTELFLYDTQCNLAINELEATDKISIYPNPTNGLITILTKSPIDKIELYTIHGQPINIMNKTSNNTIDLSDLSTGMYFLKVNSSQTFKIHKL